MRYLAWILPLIMCSACQSTTPSFRVGLSDRVTPFKLNHPRDRLDLMPTKNLEVKARLYQSFHAYVSAVQPRLDWELLPVEDTGAYSWTIPLTADLVLRYGDQILVCVTAVTPAGYSDKVRYFYYDARDDEVYELENRPSLLEQIRECRSMSE